MTDVIAVDASPGPKTHALVIGVGRYRHLRGGNAPVAGLRDMGLGQLSSTVFSARAVVEWLLNEYEHPEAPLASVQVLLSPMLEPEIPAGTIAPLADVATQAGPVPVDPATIASVRPAFAAWADRCARDKGSVGMFYFAGHGVAKDTLALLLEDFGELVGSPFLGAIDFNKTHLGTRTIPASLACFWVNSCRSVPVETLEKLTLNAQILLDSSVRKNPLPSAPIIHAAADNARAYGRRDEATQFTKALLTSLRRLGTEKRHGRWEVTPTKLFLGVEREMARLRQLELLKPANDQLPPQIPEWAGYLSGDPKIAQVATAPMVPISFTWAPGAAGAAGTLKLSSRTNSYESDRGPERWEREVTAGQYILEATFDPPWELAPTVDSEVWALPPGFDTTIEARQP